MKDKVTVNVTGVIRAPVGEVWSIARVFASAWHPAMASCELAEGTDPCAPGALRRFIVHGESQRYAERLTEFSDECRQLAYRLEEGPAGLEDYSAALQLTPASWQNWTRLSWSGGFSCARDQASAFWAGTDRIYRHGIDELARRLGVPRVLEPVGLSHVRLEVEPRIAVTSAGRGELCLFLHGIGGSREVWQQQLVSLPAGIAGAAMDYRGYNGSEDYPGPMTEDGLCDDIERVRQHFAVDKLHLVGQSMGSWLALVYHARYPQRVSSLVLTSGSVGMTRAPDEKRATFLRLREEPLQGGMLPYENAGNVLPVILSDGADGAARAAVLESLCALRKDSYLKSLRCYTNPLTVFDTAGIDVPVTLIAAALDPLAPVGEMAAVAAEIPKAQFHVIPGAGHIANMEDPGTFNTLIAGHFRALSP